MTSSSAGGDLPPTRFSGSAVRNWLRRTNTDEEYFSDTEAADPADARQAKPPDKRERRLRQMLDELEAGEFACG